MLDKLELIKALKTRELTYNLVIWLNDAIKLGVINVNKAIDYTSSFEIAKDWITKLYNNLPFDSKPENLEPIILASFTNMFLSHFNSSFDIKSEPGQRYIPHLLRKRNNEFSYLDNPHIQTKKINNRDKSQARKLKIDYIKGLMSEFDKRIIDLEIENLIAHPDLKEKIAITTYCFQLIERLKGQNEGRANLVLWREFAWDSNGSPKKKFQLLVDQVIEYELLIVDKLSGQI